MARFAEIIDGQVVNVIAVNDVECIDEFGKVNQTKGQEFLRLCNLHTLFVMSESASIGDVYDAVKDVFVTPIVKEPVEEV